MVLTLGAGVTMPLGAALARSGPAPALAGNRTSPRRDRLRRRRASGGGGAGAMPEGTPPVPSGRAALLAGALAFMALDIVLARGARRRPVGRDAGRLPARSAGARGHGRHGGKAAPLLALDHCAAEPARRLQPIANCAKAPGSADADYHRLCACRPAGANAGAGGLFPAGGCARPCGGDHAVCSGGHSVCAVSGHRAPSPAGKPLGAALWAPFWGSCWA